MSREKAQTADVRIRCSILIKEHADGTSEVRVVSDMLPPSLSRPLTKQELKDAPDAKGNPMWEGGAAILSPDHAPNGIELAGKAIQHARQIMKTVAAIEKRRA